jgi:hypothetical protein
VSGQEPRLALDARCTAVAVIDLQEAIAAVFAEKKKEQESTTPMA